LTLDQYNAFCRALPHSTHVVQWGGAHVWKIGGKVYAIAGWNNGDTLAVTFKCSAIAYHALMDQPGLRPAPYLASRGMTWIQRFAPGGMTDKSLKDHITASYHLIASGLTKKVQKTLGIVSA
jgi:predicted DNA-binding protein (MmcQ/YjbR family)